ncbi:MAG: hypothetical protein D6694_15645 [Gammaproteobacteria bacterium]|nr:MAG: hypothetical protein D6694_15645 [Gammaproteobacteria bacterium]
MPDYPNDFYFSLNEPAGGWKFLPTGQSDIGFPTPFFELPGTWTESDCEEFHLLSFDAGFSVHVTVRCSSNDNSTDSQVWDDFTFSDANDIDWGSSTAIFLRQYICRSRTSDEPDPCKQGPTPSDPPVKTF